jgi:hypothetical protein
MGKRLIALNYRLIDASDAGSYFASLAIWALFFGYTPIIAYQALMNSW